MGYTPKNARLEGKTNKEMRQFEITGGERTTEVFMEYTGPSGDLFLYDISARINGIGNLVKNAAFTMVLKYFYNLSTEQFELTEHFEPPKPKDYPKWTYAKEAVRGIIPIIPEMEIEKILRDYLGNKLKKSNKKSIQPENTLTELIS